MAKKDITIVFIPGVLNTEKLFWYQQDKLSPYFNIYNADTFHFDNMENMAQDIFDNVSGDMIVVGLSMGGYCAIEMLRQSCDIEYNRIKGIALYNTNASPITAENIKERQRRIEMSKKGRFIGVSNFILDSILGSGNIDNAKLRKVLGDMAVECGRDVFIRQQKAIIGRIDPRVEIANSDIPILCIAGDEDKITPKQGLIEISELSNNSQYHCLEKCGHMAPVEYPEKSTELLTDWIKNNFSIDL